jgi:hypothetical protein
MGVLVLTDNVGIGCAAWVLRAILCEVSEALRENGHGALSEWLTDERSPHNLFSHFDARGLKPEFQKALLAAICPAYRRAAEHGPAGWRDRKLWQSYEQFFASLVAQLDAVAAGGSPTKWPNLRSIEPYDGQQVGPGWAGVAGA